MFFFPAMLLFGLGRLLPLLLIVLLIGLVIRRLSRGPRSMNWYYQPTPPVPPMPGTGPRGPVPPVPPQSAMEILRQRYARGEIDATTFDQMRERLEGSYGQNPPPQA